MSLRLYLDECIASSLLLELLTEAGHDVVGPTDAEPPLTGASDEAQLAFANYSRRAIVTSNPKDFSQLHERQRPHCGIIGVYQDGNPDKDMRWREIADALINLEATGLELRGVFVVLNKYRW